MNKTTITAPENSPIITTERVFDANREKVFAVFTTKEHVARWWGPTGNATVDELDLREGGRWQFSEGGTPDETTTFHGYYHEVSAPKRFVQTSEFDNLEQMIGDRGHTVLAKYEFVELDDNRTQVVTTEVYMSPEDRDMALQSDMESGLVKSYEHIDAILSQAS